MAHRTAGRPRAARRGGHAGGGHPPGPATGSPTIDGDQVLLPGDVLFLQGAAAGIAELRALAGAPAWEPPQAAEEPAVSDLDRAIDVLVEMKNISEVAVGLAYSALVLRDQGLAAEVNHLEDRLDEMRERLELWVLRAAQEHVDPSPLRGLLHLAQAAEEIGDAAQQMVWLVEEGEELHPILAIALGDADEVVVRVPVARRLPGRRAGRCASCSWRPRPASTCWPSAGAAATSTGPGTTVVLQAGDELIATGPDEGHAAAGRAVRLRPHRGRGDRRGRARPRPRRAGAALRATAGSRWPGQHDEPTPQLGGQVDYRRPR